MLGSLRSKLPSAISTRLERGLDRFKAPQKRDPALRMEREFALLAADRRLLAAAVPTCEYRAMLKHISSKRELWGDDYDSDDEISPTALNKRSHITCLSHLTERTATFTEHLVLVCLKLY